MALKAVSIWGCYKPPPQLGVGVSNSHSTLIGNLRYDYDKCRKWECCCLGVLAQRATTAVEDEGPSVPPLVDSSGAADGVHQNESKGFHKDLNLLPKPLTAIDISSYPRDGSKVRVAYQGLPGAYSEDAALKAYPKCETVPCDNFEAAFKAVELWLVNKTVLPIENSVGGSVHRNYDLLLRHRLHIVGEVQLRVNHCLLGLPGVRKEELRAVVSHPQAFAQCETTLSDLGAVKIAARDTAAAAQTVASNCARDTGAIASSRAAEVYGLDILAERIQDDDENITRFLVLAREPIIPGTDRPHKTSIVFSLEEGPGVLFKALAVFAMRDINLSKIESRPLKQRSLRVVDHLNEGSATYFDYLFYIDIEASMAEPRAQYALGQLQKFSVLTRSNSHAVHFADNISSYYPRGSSSIREVGKKYPLKALPLSPLSKIFSSPKELAHVISSTRAEAGMRKLSLGSFSMANSNLVIILYFSFFTFAEAEALHSQLKQQIQDQEKLPFVGVNIGTDVSNLPSASDLVAFLQLQKITHVRIYDANSDILKTLSGTKIRVIISVPNNQLLAIGSSNSTAASWIDRNVVAYYPQTLISGISVGDEVLTTVPSSAPLILPAVESLYNALVASNLHQHIKVSTPHAASIILDPFPPSQAYFNQSLVSVILPLLQFLSRTGSPLTMNLYPYYVFMQNKGVVPLDNALFKPLTPNKEMVDPNTLLHYTNVLDAMVDAAYFSMKNLNITDVAVLVTETGWPAKGDSKEPYATKDNADTYNSNLIRHVFDRTGTPLHPETTSSVFIYELFNEDLRAPPVSEANWGLFYGNTSPAYLLHVSGIGTFLANDTTNQTYCIAMDGFDSKTLQAALDWACGPGRANCSEIQPGETCFQPNNVKNHASYAFDSYYQKEGKAQGTCDFKGLAMITTTDPTKILDRVSRLPSQSCNFRTLHFFTGQFLTTVVLLASSSKYFLEIVSVQYGLHGCVFSLSFGLFQVTGAVYFLEAYLSLIDSTFDVMQQESEQQDKGSGQLYYLKQCRREVEV
ncbi:hypothetical protein JHK85_046714 [Glycine max]|nr:hypothetical protein JHK85_046714 [Glycine max]